MAGLPSDGGRDAYAGKRYFGRMTTDLTIVLSLLGAAVLMFTLNRPRMDAVALMMMVALQLTGVITVDEALAGLSDSNIVLIAVLFVIGDSLVRPGIAQRLGDRLASRAGRNEAWLIVLLMVMVAGIGSVTSSTGVVAIFIPIVL
nr:SLC13 family permease [Microvirga massiliensis]